MSSASRRMYSSSSMSPSSNSICSAINSSSMAESSTSSSSTTRCTFPSDHLIPAMGPVTGKKRRFVNNHISLWGLGVGREWSWLWASRTPATHHSLPFRPLQLQLDVHEVVRRPRTRVLERQQVLVLARHLAHRVVEG